MSQRWIAKLVEVAKDVEAKHPGLEVAGFRHGSELDLEAESAELTFAAAPEVGGWLALANRDAKGYRAAGEAEYRRKERDRIAIDHHTCGGHPRIAGTRVTVAHVLKMLAGGETAEAIASEHPGIEPADVLDCLDYAARVLEGEDG